MNNSFIEKMAVLYQAVPSVLLVSVRLAQAIHESGWGQSELALNALNFAGIKASEPWTGETYSKISNEEIDGKMVPKRSDFRKYPTVEAFVKDHSDFVTSTEWRKKVYAQVISATTYQGQCAALTQTYASDSEYGKLLIEKIEKYDLTKYDSIQLKPDRVEIKANKTVLDGKVNDVTVKRKAIDLFSKYTGRNGKRTKVIIHNDAGSPSGLGYESWLRTARASSYANASQGFAHDYVSFGEVLNVQPLDCPAWAAANPTWNSEAYHVEVCQQLSSSDEQFKKNEEFALMRVAEVCHAHGIKPSKATFQLHTNVSRTGTSCPKRSAELHGGYAKVLDYFIERTKYYMTKGKTIEEMLANKTEKTVTQSKYFDLPQLSSNAKAFDELKVGQEVTIREGQSTWYIPDVKKGSKPSKDFTGDKDTIEKVMAVNVSYSKRAYRLKGKRSWILEQDLVEARQSWESVKVNDVVQPEIPEGKDYAFIGGKYYDIVKRK